MSSSHQPEQSTSHRRQQRQDRDDSVRGAPYLTHVVAHHGQLTLIPPQNAGRIRKPPKKKKQGSTRDRLDDEEPRFTTAVPPSSSRKLHPAPAHVRTRKHAISSPAGPSPSTSRRYDAIIDGACGSYFFFSSPSTQFSVRRPVNPRLPTAFVRGCDCLSSCRTTPPLVRYRLGVCSLAVQSDHSAGSAVYDALGQIHVRADLHPTHHAAAAARLSSSVPNIPCQVRRSSFNLSFPSCPITRSCAVALGMFIVCHSLILGDRTIRVYRIHRHAPPPSAAAKVGPTLICRPLCTPAS